MTGGGGGHWSEPLKGAGTYLSDDIEDPNFYHVTSNISTAPPGIIFMKLKKTDTWGWWTDERIIWLMSSEQHLVLNVKFPRTFFPSFSFNFMCVCSNLFLKKFCVFFTGDGSQTHEQYPCTTSALEGPFLFCFVFKFVCLLHCYILWIVLMLQHSCSILLGSEFLFGFPLSTGPL